MMSKLVLTLAALAIATAAHAGEAKDAKHRWVVPVYVSQALNIRVETPATEELLKKVGEQCIDESCKKQVAECKAVLKDCILQPSRESVRESEVENN
jgi:hypothetical protein